MSGTVRYQFARNYFWSEICDFVCPQKVGMWCLHMQFQKLRLQQVALEEGSSEVVCGCLSMQLELSSNWAAKESLLHFDSPVQLCQSNTSAKALLAIWQRGRSIAGLKSPCQPVNQSYVCRSWKKLVQEEIWHHEAVLLLVQKEENLSFYHCKTSFEAIRESHWSHIQTANSRTVEYVWHAFWAYAHSQRELPKTCKAPMHLCSIWGLQIRREGLPSFSAWSLIKIWKTCSLVSWYPSRISESCWICDAQWKFTVNGFRIMSVPTRVIVVHENMGEFPIKINVGLNGFEWCQFQNKICCPGKYGWIPDENTIWEPLRCTRLCGSFSNNGFLTSLKQPYTWFSCYWQWRGKFIYQNLSQGRM